MQTSSQTASSSVHARTEIDAPSRGKEDLAYQAVTVVAVLLLLGSLWVF
ncbi:MAG: hypothetical protein WBQ94_09265 [Terracidiphilus sp.]